MTREEAQVRIGQILQELERDSGRVVKKLVISQMDVTRLESPDRVFRRSLAIVLARHKAGDGWQ